VFIYRELRTAFKYGVVELQAAAQEKKRKRRGAFKIHTSLKEAK
jgi:hypothetical protein